ncbi:MAG: peptidyl-prolyl cis-trans isomerase [Elusimicrobiota bacterium]|nr:peptidyl-prolyl cis-trans isomerase [Elusimicrobiota bacterium]
MILALLLAALALPAAAAEVADPVIVTVNGVPIRRSEVVERVLSRYGAQTVDEMVNDLLLRQEAAANKLTAPEAAVNHRFEQLRGRFATPELFMSQLEQAGTSVSRVKEELAEDIVQGMVITKARGIFVTDAEVERAFEKNKEQLGAPPAVHLRHILAATEAEAKALVKKIEGGADFGALAREKSLAASGKAAGGDYGFVAPGMLPPEIDKIAFGLKAGEIKIVPGSRGHHILQALEHRPGKPAVFDEVKTELRAMLLAEKIKAAAPEVLAELRRKAAIDSPGAPAPGRPPKR